MSTIEVSPSRQRVAGTSPRDPGGLTVLSYALFWTPGEERRCRDTARYLLKLDPKDAFAEQIVVALKTRER